MIFHVRLFPSLTSTLILHKGIKIRPINSQIHSKVHLQEIVRCSFKLNLDLDVIPSLSNKNVLTVTA
jgi:hypothetical protein